ncbi:hypothetical protein N5U00_10565 [Aliarcobacter butzleri]|uniref:hypothetical protein n=1 Tax=Aliarcobacter butzleri TaxID=28197 RepID=UPI0021B4A056|nr:hypothetical protein [Aliarcobacter butzleri]MCT7570415.1 hypothetical protein [Aliarcobacter butzleri]MCT7573587.1 hypothetical protein [Aliarcobacter butzleri]MCT7575772.1 hypothetical protein [Aliarcobacter butzleri]MCT7579836.1 hypothetical protein [Aliarcobacter butzleri]
MKGTIVDFDEIEKRGLILAEDGNRYPFDLSKWKSKNKSPELDVEVDFVVDENQVSDIYSLSKNIPEVKATNEKVENPIQNQSYSDIKKINFEEIENKIDTEINNEINDTEKYIKEKKEARKSFFISLPILLVEMMFITVSNDVKWYFLSLILGLIFIITALISVLLLIRILMPKKLENKLIKMERKSNIINEYKKYLKIINYTPNNLNFDNIKIINVKANTLEEAENKLLNEAYELRADAIINYSNQFNTISNVRTTGIGSGKSVSTSVTAVNSISGLAIKIKA